MSKIVLFSSLKCNWVLSSLKKDAVVFHKDCNNLTHYWSIACFLLAADPARVIFRIYGWSSYNIDSSPFFSLWLSTGCQWNCECYYGKGLDEYSLGHTDVVSWPSNGEVWILQYSLGHADVEFLSSNGEVWILQYSLGHADVEFLSSNGAGLVSWIKDYS